MTTATGAPHNASLEPNPMQGQHGFTWDFLSDRPEAGKWCWIEGAGSHAGGHPWLQTGDSSALGCLPNRRGSIWARSRRTPRSCHPRPPVNRRRPDPQRSGQQRYGEYQSAIGGGDECEWCRRRTFFVSFPVQDVIIASRRDPDRAERPAHAGITRRTRSTVIGPDAGLRSSRPDNRSTDHAFWFATVERYFSPLVANSAGIVQMHLAGRSPAAM